VAVLAQIETPSSQNNPIAMMKKFQLAVVLGAVLVVLLSQELVSAQGGPPSGEEAIETKLGGASNGLADAVDNSALRRGAFREGREADQAVKTLASGILRAEGTVE